MPANQNAPITNCVVDCCGRLVPDTLFATLSGNVNCSCATGTVALVHGILGSTWGTDWFPFCGNQMRLELDCAANVEEWAMWRHCPAQGQERNPLPGATCDPSISMRFNMSGCCEGIGSFFADVTE